MLNFVSSSISFPFSDSQKVILPVFITATESGKHPKWTLVCNICTFIHSTATLPHSVMHFFKPSPLFAVGFLTAFADKEMHFSLSSCFQPFLPAQEGSISPMAWGFLSFTTKKPQKRFLNICQKAKNIFSNVGLSPKWQYTSLYSWRAVSCCGVWHGTGSQIIVASCYPELTSASRAYTLREAHQGQEWFECPILSRLLEKWHFSRGCNEMRLFTSHSGGQSWRWEEHCRHLCTLLPVLAQSSHLICNRLVTYTNLFKPLDHFRKGSRRKTTEAAILSQLCTHNAAWRQPLERAWWGAQGTLCTASALTPRDGSSTKHNKPTMSGHQCRSVCITPAKPAFSLFRQIT